MFHHSPNTLSERLRFRAALLARLRKFFDERGFVEVDTPVLSRDVVVERHLDPLAVTVFDDPRRPEVGERFYLQTSPEAGMKRLLAAGATAIYQVAKAFRGGERGRHHNIEFTMVEWYRVGDSLEAGITLLGELACAMLEVKSIERTSYAEAFRRWADVDAHRDSPERLAQAARRLNIVAPDSLLGADRDAWLNLLLAEAIEPKLGADRPTILYDYPATQSALAQVRPGATPVDPPVAERFELYYQGVELANGYHELLDAEELERRTVRENAARVADGRPALPGPVRLISAMRAGLPDCSGVALGFDRLAMLAQGGAAIDEVIAFPFEQA